MFVFEKIGLAIITCVVILFWGCTKETNYVPTAYIQDREVVVYDTIVELLDTNVSQCVTVCAEVSELSVISRRVTPLDSASVTLKEATLSVPIGAVSHSVTLSITALNSTQIPRLPQGMVNVTHNASGFRFLPHGEHFIGANAHITLPIDTLLIPQGYTHKDIFVYYYNETHNQWQALPKDTANHIPTQVCALTTHFTDMIAGILQVPEMPETQGFVPTVMSNVKAADPLQGIISVQISQATQSGAATLSYPIALPKGRNGMQPDLALTYSSEAHNSWCGYGWSLALPSIDIDTRWGVPKFDQQYETEIYLINGEQTTLQPHRSPESIARQSNREFYPRVESAFSKIVRYGNSPKNYLWEVTTKDGIVYEYRTVVKNDEGNIIHWGLSKVSESHGDNVTYSYTEKNGYLYPTEIQYTKHHYYKGSYSVKFKYSEDKDNIRHDVTTNYRLGLQQIDSELLSEISVYYKNELLSRYVPKYEVGALRKTILTSITQYDSDNKEVGTNNFDYYNDLQDGLWGEAETWKAGGDKFQVDILKDNWYYVNNYSSIGSSSTEGKSWGGGLSLGAGFFSDIASVHAGYAATWNRSTSEAEITLVDINGDGLPDKVFAQDGKLCYRSNLAAQGRFGFGEVHEVHGLPEASLSRTKVEGFSWSVNGSIGIKIGKKKSSVGAGVSYDDGTTKSRNVIYIQDFNGDGLVDISSNGTVYFNHIGAEGEPYFTTNSFDTQAPILGQSNLSLVADFEEDPDSLRAELEANNPRRDVVRLWRAPFDGKVKVIGSISLTTDNATWNFYEGTPDGVKISIQYENKVIWEAEVNTPSETASHNKTLQVKAGDRLFFRVSPKYSGALDEVNWNSTITYTKTSDSNIPDVDENGLSTKTYTASEDFLHVGDPTVILAGPCEATLNMPIVKKQLRGDVVLAVEASSQNIETTNIWEKILKSNETVNSQYTKTISVAAGDTVSLDFYIRSNAALDWSGITWAPSVEISNGKDQTTMYAAPEIEEMYNKPIMVRSAQTLIESEPSNKTIVDTTYQTTKANNSWTLSSSIINTEYSPNLTATTTLSISQYTCDSTSTNILFTLADADSVFYSERAYVEGKNYKGLQFSIPAAQIGKNIYANFYSESEVTSVKEAYVSFSRDVYEHHSDTYYEVLVNGDTIYHDVKWTIHYTVDLNTITAGVNSKYAHTELGNRYRGWGQFAWDGETDALTVDDLEYDPEKYNINESTLEDRDALTNVTSGSPLKSMAFDAEYNRWRGENDNIYISAVGMSPSRMGEPEIVVETAEHPNEEGTLASVTPYVKSENHGISYNGSFKIAGAGASGGQSRSTSETKAQVAIMDINGDRYPDWLYASGSEMTGRLTNMLGRTTEEQYTMPNGLNNSSGKARATTADASATFPIESSNDAESGASKIQAPANTSKSTGTKGLQDRSNSLLSASGCAVSLSGTFSKSEDYTERELIDINGDGLPDIVYTDGKVRFGKGGSFTQIVNYGQEAIRKSTAKNIAAGGGVNIPIVGYASIGFGKNFTHSDNKDTFIMQDVDGDGLPDKIDGSRVAFNNGVGFDDYEDLSVAASKSTSVALTTYGNTAVPVKIGPIFGFSLYVTPSVTGTKSSSFSRTECQLIDIDGDGYVDMVETADDGNIIVRKNKAATANLLKQVTSPLGAKTIIEYEPTGNTYDLPQCRMVMSKVTAEGGNKRNGATRFATVFTYKNGYYDRFEREFFGFGEVSATQLDTENDDAPYRTTTHVFDNHRYETRNCVIESRVATADGTILNRVENNYITKAVHDSKSIFVAPSQTKSTKYEVGCEDVMTISESYEYDAKGNVISYTNATPTDSYTIKISYHTLTEKHIFTRPSEVKVFVDNKLQRHTTSKVNKYGDLLQINKIAKEMTATTDMEYDEYGNVTKLTRPQNTNGQRFFREYTYDDIHHSLITSIKDAFGYQSSTDYDSKWCVPTKQTDINGNEMRYAYDHRGRITSVTAPYELESGNTPTISIEYDDKNHIAKTTNYDAKTKTSVVTYLFTDNLGRAIQTKKSGLVDGKEVMIASSVVKYDALGRKVAEGQPVTDKTTTLNTSEILNPTLTEYDIQDRTIQVTLPDGTTSLASYTITDGCIKATQTDANCHVTDSYTDIRGKERKRVQHSETYDVVTEFNYNAIGELQSVIHPNLKTTTYEYDGLGREVSVNHPDAGLTTFEYDAAGNMTSKQTPNLRQYNGKISYTYDYERLSEIIYPKNIYNRVTYTYGDSSETKYNRVGRLKLVEDGSGGEAYFYGKLGEVTKTIKTVILAETNIRTYIWEADYDSWNRINTMTYPDGEVVTYNYDKGGNLFSVTTDKDGDKQTLIAEQRYDKYGNLIYRKMGNGTETTYAYDDKRLHLNSMSLACNGMKIMENVYKYDSVDNILSISNAAKPQSELGGTFSHSYVYDELNRLVNASGSAKGKNYDLLMCYDVMSNPLLKDSITYDYNTNNHANAVSRAGSRIFRYDANGNPISVEDTTANTLRVMQWDEENRMQSLGDDGYVSRYTYNHVGDRAVKSHGGTTVAYVNGAPQGVLWHDADNWTMYVSPYMVVNAKRFTKHYYVGTQRIASKIGTGEFNNLYDASKACVTAGQKDYSERLKLITQSRNDYYAAHGIPPGPPTAKGIYGEPEYSGAYGSYMITPLGNYDVPTGWPMKPYKRPYGGTPGPPVMYQRPTDPEDEGAGYGYSNAEGIKERELFFYHSDHLGSATYITDANGDVTQFICYKPYGETFVDEHAVALDMPWKFNGKEWDAETGLYYYGARYYEPSLGLWYGVDALTEKYSSVGGYVYCVGNPVNFIDPNGNSTHTTVDGTVIAIYADDDYGVYAHPESELAGFDRQSKLIGGCRLPNDKKYKRGETWTLFGFANFEKFEKNQDYDNIPISNLAKIDWESGWADCKINQFFSDDPSTLYYMLNAGNNEKYDFKVQAPSSNVYYGSKMFGKYISARDLGNFAAGVVKASSFCGSIFIQWGYGIYNLTKNKYAMLGIMYYDWFLISSCDNAIRTFGYDSFLKHSYSEDTFSQQGIDAGYNYWKSRNENN